MPHKRKPAGLALPQYHCKKCSKSLDFNEFDALQGYCNTCYQEVTYGEKPLNYIREESCRGETF